MQEIFPFMKMSSWRFIYWRLKCSRFIPFQRFVHGDLSFENLNRRFIPWRFVHGNLSFEDLFRRFILLKFWFGDLSFEIFQEICPFENFIFGDFSFLKNVLGDLSFWNFLGDLSFWKFDFRRFFLFEKCFWRFILLKFSF